jgi:Tfp pilus assembly protein PilF
MLSALISGVRRSQRSVSSAALDEVNAERRAPHFLDYEALHMNQRLGRAPLHAFALLVLAAGTAQAAPPQTDGEANFLAGLNHLQENRPALAVEEFKKAIRLDPKSPYSHKGLGIAYTQMRRYPEAITTLRKALELNPYYVDVRNDLGTALVLSGKREEGKAEFLAAYNDPTNPRPELTSYNLANAYLEEKKYAEAANWFRTSLGRSKQNVEAYLGLADALLALGQPDEAVGPLEAGLKELPGHVGLLASLGDAYYRIGRFPDARTRLEEAARRDPVGASGKRATELLKHLPRP